MPRRLRIEYAGAVCLVEGSGNRYLRTASDYVHLHPVRARRLQPQERWLADPWRRFGAYLAAPAHRPSWVRVDRLPGEHGIQAIAARMHLGSSKSAILVEEDPQRTPVAGQHQIGAAIAVQVAEHRQGIIAVAQSGRGNGSSLRTISGGS